MTVSVEAAMSSRLFDTCPLRRASLSFFSDAGSVFCSDSSITAKSEHVAARHVAASPGETTACCHRDIEVTLTSHGK